MEAMAARPVIKVAALCGSLRKGSFNRGLLRSAIQLTKESVNGMEIEYIDISPLPMLNTDLEVDGTYPPVVEAFRQKILQADSVLFASPEYNYSVTGPLKNAIDWASRPPNCWADKAAAIVSAGGSFGGGRAQYHLRQIGVYLDLHFINKPEFYLNAFASPAKFDSDGNLIDQPSKDRIKEVLLSLLAFTWRLKDIVQAKMVRGAENSVIKVAALSGSLRKGSYNEGLIRAAIEQTKESTTGMEIEHIDISELPMQNIDLEGNGENFPLDVETLLQKLLIGTGSFPPAVEAFRQKILEADGILFASPEHNYSVSAPMKNAIDWASRPPNVWADKPAAIISASGGMGGARGQLHLRQIGIYIDIHFINKPEFFLNAFQPPAKFDSQGNLIDEQAKESLKDVLLALQAFTLRLKGNKC